MNPCCSISSLWPRGAESRWLELREAEDSKLVQGAARILFGYRRLLYASQSKAVGMKISEQGKLARLFWGRHPTHYRKVSNAH